MRLSTIVKIKNPNRPDSYVGSRGYAANRVDAHVFEEVMDAARRVDHLMKFSHLDDQFFYISAF